jgi:DNA-binding response OmpR family regulator
MMSKILVIGDPGINELIRLILERQRDHVRCISDGHGGLSAAEQDQPDLIVIYLWTTGLDAFEFYRLAQASPTLREIPILIYSAMPPERAYPTIQPLGVPGYLCAPFKIEELVAARDTLLRGETYFPQVG